MRSIGILLLWVHFLGAEPTLDERVEVLEKRLVLQTEQTVLSIGGRICLDAVMNSQSVGGSSAAQKYDYFFAPQSLQPFLVSERLEGTANVKNSRFWVKTRRDTEIGRIQTLFEIDFWGSEGNEQVSNAHNPRIRHAYVTLNEWLIGQSFSAFIGSYADTVQSSMDVVVSIQPQLRYEKKVGNDLALTLSLEQPETTVLTSSGIEGVNDERIPDAIVKLNFVTHTFELMGALLSRVYSYDTYSNSLAWGVNVNARYFINGIDRIDAGFVKGNAIGRYVAFNYFSDATIVNNKLVGQEIEGGHVSFLHWWNRTLRSSVQASYITNSNEYSYAVQSNVRYTVVKDFLASMEYAYAQKQVSQSSYRLHRLYVSMQYDF